MLGSLIAEPVSSTTFSAPSILLLLWNVAVTIPAAVETSICGAHGIHLQGLHFHFPSARTAPVLQMTQDPVILAAVLWGLCKDIRRSVQKHLNHPR
jgi:hypothetical protein